VDSADLDKPLDDLERCEACDWVPESRHFNLCSDISIDTENPQGVAFVPDCLQKNSLQKILNKHGQRIKLWSQLIRRFRP